MSITSVSCLDLYCVTLCTCSIAVRCSELGQDVTSDELERENHRTETKTSDHCQVQTKWQKDKILFHLFTWLDAKSVVDVVSNIKGVHKIRRECFSNVFWALFGSYKFDFCFYESKLNFTGAGTSGATTLQGWNKNTAALGLLFS